MSEQAEYNVKAEVAEALETLGKGYESPTVIVEAPRKYVVRKGGKLVEHDEPAWVKFSTDFKTELASMNEYSLKVFIYIGLSVNFATGEARPGLRRIAKDTGMDKDTAAKSINDLVEKGFLSVQKRDGTSNIYKPIRFVTIGKGVRPEGTPTQEPSDENAEPSDVCRIKHTQLELTRLKDAATPSSQKPKKDAVDFEIDFHLKPKAIRDAFAKYFKLTPNWEAKYNRQFLEWMVEMQVTPEQVEQAADLWRMDRRFNWQAPTLKGIQEHWLELTETSQPEPQRVNPPLPDYSKAVPRPAHVPPPRINKGQPL
jgi:DNA-binding MarR family transcriptional regulator